MMLSLVLALAIGDPTPATTATPAPSYTAPPGWTIQPPKGGELAEFSRNEPDGTTSIITLRAQVCDCEPAHMMDMLQAVMDRIPNVGITRKTATECGRPAETFLVSGLADEALGRKNFFAAAFRSTDTLYTQQYVFGSAAPKADAMAAAQALCP